MLGANEAFISIRLFGSHVRGDADASSDIDVLVIADKKLSAEEACALGITPGADISIYSADRIRSMFMSGHLFAWHLYCESKPYIQGSKDPFFEALGTPAPYTEGVEDSKMFLAILVEAIDAIRDKSNYVFEAGVIHLAMRNIGIALSYHLTGRPDFSRYAALNLPKEYSPKLSKSSYDRLVQCRYISKRGYRAVPPPHYAIEELVEYVEQWAIGLVRGGFNE